MVANNYVIHIWFSIIIHSNFDKIIDLYNYVVNCITQCYCSTAPDDYISVSSEPLTFTRGNPIDSVTITIRDDTIVEGFESFVARLSVNTALYPGVRLAPDTANVSIRDDDGNTKPDVSLQHFCIYMTTTVLYWHT